MSECCINTFDVYTQLTQECLTNPRSLVAVVREHGDDAMVGRLVAKRRVRQHTHVLRPRQHLPDVERGECSVHCVADNTQRLLLRVGRIQLLTVRTEANVSVAAQNYGSQVSRSICHQCS